MIVGVHSNGAQKVPDADGIQSILAGMESWYPTSFGAGVTFAAPCLAIRDDASLPDLPKRPVHEASHAVIYMTPSRSTNKQPATALPTEHPRDKAELELISQSRRKQIGGERLAGGVAG